MVVRHQRFTYKIHLYGPGGHFKSHRDLPETGLVGTFLVGLGDTSSASTGHFRIGNKMLKSYSGNWVAFHPDVPHEITKPEDGYRDSDSCRDGFQDVSGRE